MPAPSLPTISNQVTGFAIVRSFRSRTCSRRRRTGRAGFDTAGKSVRSARYASIMFAEPKTKPTRTEDLSALSREALEEELAAQAAHVDAGLCRLVELAAECERRLDWGADGTTFASWLAWRCSLPPRVAREHE